MIKLVGLMNQFIDVIKDEDETEDKLLCISKVLVAQHANFQNNLPLIDKGYKDGFQGQKLVRECKPAEPIRETIFFSMAYLWSKMNSVRMMLLSV